MICAGHKIDLRWLLQHQAKIRDNHGDIPAQITPEHLWLAAHGKPVIPHQVTEEVALEWLKTSGAVILPSTSNTTEDNPTSKVVEKVTPASSKAGRKG